MARTTNQRQQTSNTETVSSAVQIGAVWRLANLVVAVLLTSRAYLLVASDPDWWIWAPVYAVGSVLSFGIGATPSVARTQPYRYLIALMIVAGCGYVAYSCWLIRDVAAVAYFWPDTTLMEGRELLPVTLSVQWCVLNRLYLHRLNSLANVLRLLIFIGLVVLLSAPAAFAACFYPTLAGALPFCQVFLRPDSLVVGM